MTNSSTRRPSGRRSAPTARAVVADATIEFIARGLILHRNHLLVCWALRPATAGESPRRNYCYLPGGHVESAEPAQAAVRRELLEESGRPVKVGDLLLTHEQSFATKTRRHHELNLVFQAEILRGGRGASPPVVASLEPWIEFSWLSRAELRRADLRPGAMKAWILEHWERLNKGGVAAGWMSSMEE